jgi:hypothetical protein
MSAGASAAPPPPPPPPSCALDTADAAADACAAAQEAVLRSPLLLPHILSGVEPDQLAACSLVSRPWREAAIRVSFNRVVCCLPSVVEALDALPRPPASAVYLSLVRKLDALLQSGAAPLCDDGDDDDDGETLDDFRLLLELTTAAGEPVAGGVLALRLVEGGAAAAADEALPRGVCAAGELTSDNAGASAPVRVKTPSFTLAVGAGGAVGASLPPVARAPLAGALDVRNLRLRVSALRVSAAAVAPLWSALPPETQLDVDADESATSGRHTSLVFSCMPRDVHSHGAMQGLPGFALDMRPPSAHDANDGAAIAAQLIATVRLPMTRDAGGVGTATLSRASVDFGCWVGSDAGMPLRMGIAAAQLRATLAALDWEPLLLRPEDVAPPEQLRRRCALPQCGAAEAHPKAFMVCSRCRMAAYCSAAHQRADWQRHKRYDACAPPAAVSDVSSSSSSSGDDDAVALLVSQRWPAHAAALALLLRAGRVASSRPFAALAAAMAARAAESEQARYVRLHERASPSAAARYSLLVQLHHGSGVCFAAAAPLAARPGHGDELRFDAASAPQDACAAKLVLLFHTTKAQALCGAAVPAAPGSPLLRVDAIDSARLVAHAWLLRQCPDGRVQLSRWAANMRLEPHCGDGGSQAFAAAEALVQPAAPSLGAHPRGLCHHGRTAALRTLPYLLLCQHIAHQLSMDTLEAGAAAPPPPPPSVLHTPYVLGGVIGLRPTRVPNERLAMSVPEWVVYSFDGVTDATARCQLGLGLFNPAQPGERRLVVTQSVLADVARRMEWRTLVPPARQLKRDAAL